MIILLACLIVFLFAGLSVTVHKLWIVAVVPLVLCVAGFAPGRRETAGLRPGWYRW